MIKGFIQIVIILAVAALISAGLSLWVNQMGSTGLAGGESDLGRPAMAAGQAPTDQASQSTVGVERQADEFGGAGAQRGLIDMLSKLGIIAAITAAVALIQKGMALIPTRWRLARS
jgi:hypothetical protein